MKILDNTKARINAGKDTCALYALVTDDYSRMYNQLHLNSLDDFINDNYTIDNNMRKRLKELPILAQNFYNEEELHRLYPELFI